MKTFRDFLIFYNKREVVPFLVALDIKFSFYKKRKMDMFKDGISVPKLTLKFMFSALPLDVHFYLLSEQTIDLQDTPKDGLTGGLPLFFTAIAKWV